MCAHIAYLVSLLKALHNISHHSLIEALMAAAAMQAIHTNTHQGKCWEYSGIQYLPEGHLNIQGLWI